MAGDIGKSKEKRYCIPSSSEVEMRWEHTLTIRMIGRMTTFGSRTYWILSGKRGRKSEWKEREGFGNGTAELHGMDNVRCKLTLSGEFWISTWVWSGEHMERYDGFEIIYIRWNGWSIIIVREVPAVFEGEWTALSLSKLRQFRRWESRRNICVFVFVCMFGPEWQCPFVGRECVCHAVPLGVAEWHKYVMFIMVYCPSWTLLWPQVWRWDKNIHVPFVHCIQQAISK